MTPKKRFWTEVDITKAENGFAVELDGRGIKTPAKALLVLPTQELANLVADEWRAVEGDLDPSKMPATRMTNSAIDAVSVRKDQVVDVLSDYAASDLLCYWAEGPKGLIEIQKQKWQPVLEWISAKYGLSVVTTSGIMPVQQDPKLRNQIRSEIIELSPFEIAGLHDVIVLSGSAFLAMAWKHREIDESTAWLHSRVDADWQIGQWGEDEDEAKVVAIKRADFYFATNYCRLAQIDA